MRVRALDVNGDWTFGAGRNNYKSRVNATAQNIKTRLKSFLGDCFFDTGAGIDWFNLLGSKNQLALNLAINSTILNTRDVTGMLQLSVVLDANRQVTISYKVQTIYSQIADIFQYDVNGLT